jgi:ABC-type transport system, involved in lipoprotein release, permease component
MFRFITQKLLNKKWLILSIIIGNILLVGIACCNPMYSRAAMQKMLTSSMSTYLSEKNAYPGLLTIDARLSNTQIKDSSSAYFNDFLTVNDTVERMIGDPATHKIAFYEFNNAQNAKFEVSRTMIGDLQVKIASLTKLEEKAEIVAGRMYREGIDSDGCIECIVNEKAYLSKSFVVGDKIEVYGYTNENGDPLRVCIVGVFKAKDTTDPYWVNDPLSYHDELFVPQETYIKQFFHEGSVQGNIRARYYTLYDYTKISIDSVPQMLKVYRDLKKDYASRTCLYYPLCNYEDVFEQYLTDSSKVKATMWILQVPILVLLAVFIFMVSNQVIGIEQAEIAMLKSRGVSRWQLILTYLIQASIVGVIALVIGIPIGYLLCHVFGSTNAFLSFVGRKAMDIRLTGEAIGYAVVSCIAGILIQTLPVLKYARFSIVEQKTKKRKSNRPMWQRMFLDFALLLIAFYGYYDFSHQKDELMKAVAKGESVNPMLFFSASLFILSCAIVFLRVIPLLSSLVFRIGRRFWRPAAYASFLQITRDSRKQSFITVFLVLTIALGIFNANIARTVNQNEEDRIRYTDGADIVVKEQWISNATNVKNGYDSQLRYTEPDFKKYEELVSNNANVLAATKVLHETDATSVIAGETLKDIQLYGINTYEFGHTAWMPEGITDRHWYEELNALASNPEGVIVSKSMMETYELEIGDGIVIERTDELGKSLGKKYFTIVAATEYWPGYVNKREVEGEDGEIHTVPVNLAICNYDNLLLDYPVVPYEVWIKTTGGSQFFYDWAAENNVKFATFEDRASDVIGLKNDPYFQITNGMLTITFIVVLVLCAIGFLIFWITSIRSRELIFGIYRAMGMSMGELIRMLINEHFFGSILPILFGAGVGLLASKLFIPLIQIAYSPKIPTIPSKIVIRTADLAQIGIVVAVMLALCITVISVLLSKIKINQALKLGED